MYNYIVINATLKLKKQKLFIYQRIPPKML